MMAAFDQGLGEHGHIVGRNVRTELRWANGQYEKLPELAVRASASRSARLARRRRCDRCVNGSNQDDPNHLHSRPQSGEGGLRCPPQSAWLTPIRIISAGGITWRNWPRNILCRRSIHCASTSGLAV